ncbi:MAG: TRAP transporter small permease [Pseudomonadota bacterium]
MSTNGPADTAVSRRLDGALNRLLTGMNAIGSLWILVLLVIINTDSFGRTLFNEPFTGVAELVELSLIAIVFLQLGDTVRLNRLTRSDGLLTILSRRRPALERVMRICFDLAGAVLMILILVGAWTTMIHAIERGEYFGNQGLFVVPEWPVRVIVVIGTAVCLARFLLSSWLMIRGGPTTPAGQSSTAGFEAD